MFAVFTEGVRLARLSSLACALASALTRRPRVDAEERERSERGACAFR
jgi:hypothetical protein